MVIVIRASGRHGLLETLIVIVIRAMSYHVLHDWPLQTDEPGANSLITLYPKNSTTFEGVNSMNVRHKSVGKKIRMESLSSFGYCSGS